MTGYAFHSLTVADVRRETDDTVSVAFAVPDELADPYRFAPGQHLTLRIVLAGEELRRSYSVCSGVDDGELRVAVKRVPGGRFSGWVHETLRVGDRVEVMTPAGRFTTALDPDGRRHYLAVAAGSGITPVMSILRTVLAREPHGTFTLVYGNRTVSSIIFRDALNDLKDRYLDRLQVLHVLSRQQLDAPLLNGRITGEKMHALARGVLDVEAVDEAFLCGPEPMTLEVRDALAELGMDLRHVHLELFGTPHVTSARVGPAGADAGEVREVTVVLGGVKTGVSVPVTKTVLEAGLAAGLDLPFSCQGGVCATCRAKVCDGEVDMATNYALEPWEVEAGYVLTCQSRPVTASVTVDYDAP